jgi:hypothetical protein
LRCSFVFNIAEYITRMPIYNIKAAILAAF